MKWSDVTSAQVDATANKRLMTSADLGTPELLVSDELFRNSAWMWNTITRGRQMLEHGYRFAEAIGSILCSAMGIGWYVRDVAQVGQELHAAMGVTPEEIAALRAEIDGAGRGEERVS